MKPSLLILSTESLAEVLHDEHALQNGPRFLDGKDRVCVLMWRGKVGRPEHSAECDRWRAIAEKFSEHLMTWLSASATPPVAAGVSQPSASADADARDHHLTTGTASLAPEQKEFNATRSDAAQAISSMAAKIASLKDELYALTHERNELKAHLLDRTAEAAQLAERAARLEHTLKYSRKQETQLIQERNEARAGLNETQATLKRIRDIFGV